VPSEIGATQIREVKMRIEGWSRRSVLGSLGVGAAFVGLPKMSLAQGEKKARGNIKQSVCRWCYGKLTLEQLSEAARKIGLRSIELIGPDEFKTVKAYGLTCAMARGAGTIESGLNRIENHERLEQQLRNDIDFAAAAKIPNVICFSGNRKGMPDDEGLKNCVAGAKRLVGYAEKMGVTVCMELLNSKVNHKDYMCDHTSWGAELVRQVGSPRFKLLYDIYHMQIMEGDVIRTIRDNKEYIAHYHTGGVPGRNEIDETQELNYPAIMKAILETGYTGFVGQEFVPTRDPLTSLAQAYKICDV
jgi:hydroxypyruvate isomerase